MSDKKRSRTEYEADLIADEKNYRPFVSKAHPRRRR